jgi:hypothetical protein
MAFMNLNNMPINDRGEVWAEGQLVGQMPGGGGGVGAGRDAIVQSVLAQQGMPPPPLPQVPQVPQMQPQGGGNRLQIGQGWSTEGNNVFDPGGNIVGRHGLQQYGAIPGVTRPGPGGDPFNQFGRPVGSSLSGGMPGTTMQGGAPTATDRDAFSGTPAQDWGGVLDAFGNSPLADPTMTAPDMHTSPHATPTFDVDQNGMPNAPDMTPGGSLTDPGAQGGFGGADFAGGDFGGFGGFDAGGMGMDTAGGVG